MVWEGLDEPALDALAARVAGSLRPGDIVVLAGEVGAGKTAFTRAAARALGVKERVTSPTYQIARSYEGYRNGDRLLVNHLDLYRLEEAAERDALELDDYLDPRAVTFIEWAEPALGLVEDPTVVFISHETPATRRIELTGPAAIRLNERDDEH
ncbi:MAG: tRNA (adenosine(37)-N6)-threonylcarbamoyltransferase complex ATPase subunit type 1 TsaE [Rubrobacteraceae bacterium]